MTRGATPKLRAYAGLAAGGFLAALVLELPELAAVAAPFALVAALGLALAVDPAVTATLALDRDALLEGEELEAEVTVRSERGGAVELLLRLPQGLELADGETPNVVRLVPGEPRQVRLRVRVERWGAYALGDLYTRAWSPFGLVRYEARFDCRTRVKAYPRPEAARQLLRPVQTQVFSGNYVSRERGEGIEFADLRPFAPGDRIRRVNWRASARRGELWVNEYHPERNADVVVFLDSFTAAGDERETTLDRGVRAASALISGYLRHKDRVGFVSFGGRVNWLRPQTGIAQLYRIVDALLDTQVVLNYAWRHVDALPRQTLPPKALVLALTPLLDERSIGALLDLRGRGFDLVVIELSPLPFVAAGKGEGAALAYRIWRLQRDAVRGRFERAGVPVGVWDEGGLAAGLEEVRAYRRSAARVHG